MTTDELREQIDDVLTDINTSSHSSNYLSFHERKPLIDKLVALTKRIALEARIDELEQHRSNKHSDWTVEQLDNRRLELESQLEQLNDK